MLSAGALNPAERDAALRHLRGGELDLLIVGGGITGAGAALDAAARGLNVALVEKTDLAAGASSGLQLGDSRGRRLQALISARDILAARHAEDPARHRERNAEYVQCRAQQDAQV